jgi:hypothetical protein
VSIVAEFLSERAQAYLNNDSALLCYFCHAETHLSDEARSGSEEEGGNIQTQSIDPNSVTTESETAAAQPGAAKKSGDVDLAALYNIDDMEVTVGKTNSSVNPSKDGSIKAETATRLKGFRKVVDNKVVSQHATHELNVNSLRKFATKIGAKAKPGMEALRKAKKVDVCEALVDKKTNQDEAIATGVGPVIDANHAVIKINRKRAINVWTSPKFREHLLKLDEALGNTELTDNQKSGQAVMEAFLELYNSDDPEFDRDQHPELDFAPDASKFQKLPSSFWKQALKEFKKVGSVSHCVMLYQS